MNEEFKTRQQYIRANNEMNRGVDSKQFIKGNNRKVELDRKLDELTINSGISFSGNLVRQNILDSSESRATTFNSMQVYEEDEDKQKKELPNMFNRGKDIIGTMKQDNSNNNNLNKIKRNI